MKKRDPSPSGGRLAEIRGRGAIHTRNGHIAIVVAVVLFAVLIVFATLVGAPWAEFWRIAIPGLLTGIGTLVLAGTTVWLSTGQHLRDDQLREEQRIALQTQADVEALRDARKVFAVCRALDEDHRLYVINASPDPIFLVKILGEAKSPTTGADLQWNHGAHQEDVAYVLPGNEHPFAGDWIEAGERADLVYWAPRELPITVEWTDGRGHLWERCGFAEPKLRLAR